jgi:hypothetical protein
MCGCIIPLKSKLYYDETPMIWQSTNTHEN